MIAAPDLLVVGGLSIDRFPDGTTAPGGSVLHAARAVAASGGRVATITLAGREPAAQAAIAELARLGPSAVRAAERTIGFAIDESDERRSLTLEAAAGTLAIEADEVEGMGGSAVLVAPIAGEIDADAIRAVRGEAINGAALQGWLRLLVPGRQVAPLPLAAMPADLVAELVGFDLLVASTDDLLAEATSPDAQLDALRHRFGSRPTLIVTEGERGAHLDVPRVGRYAIPGQQVVSRSTVGAGDAFAGLVAMHLGRGVEPAAAAADASTRVAELLAGSG